MKIDVMIIVGVVAGLLLGAAGVYFLAPKTDITPLETQIADLQASQAQQQSQIHNLQVQATEYETQIQQLNQQILDEEAEYASLEADYLDMEGDKTLLQTTLSQKNIELTNLYAQVSLLEDQVETLEYQVNLLSGLTQIGYISSSFSAVDNTTDILEEWIGKANTTIQLMVTRLHLGDLSTALMMAYNRSVDIKIVIDTDERYKSGSAFTDLLNSGIDIRGDNSTKLMHHKVIIIDDHILAVGSYDWTSSSELTQDDSILLLDSAEVASYYKIEFDRVWSQTSPETIEPETQVNYVLLNEIETNPAGSDPGFEWVELYNPTNDTIDIGLWWVVPTGGDYQYVQYIPWGTTIDPLGYYILTTSVQWFDNEGEMVLLKDADEKIIDTSPVMDDIDGDNYTWQRIPNGYDSDSVSDWIYAEGTQNAYNNATTP